MNPSYRYKATYLGNYDGDSIKLRIDLGFSVETTQNIRLLDVDTPELRGVDDETRARGELARDYVQKQLSTAVEIVVETERGKSFDRWLAHIWYKTADMSEFKHLGNDLLAAGLADKYEK